MIIERIAEMEQALSERGLSVEALRCEAGIARSTWQRWKAGSTNPNFATFSKVEAAFERLFQENAA